MFDSIFVPNMGQRKPNDYPPDWTLLKRMMWVRMSQIPPTPEYDTIGPDSIVSFNAIHAARIKKLLVTLTPQQNLNGYSNPWPAGGGKNKAKLSADIAGDNQKSTPTYTDTGVVLDATGTYGRYGWVIPVTQGTTYCVSFKVKGSQDAGSGYNNKVLLADTDGIWTPSNEHVYRGFDINKAELDASYTFEARTSILFFGIYATSSATSETITLTELMLEVGSSKTTFAPYSNICPISGFDGVTVEQTGKNLLPKLTAGTYGANGVTVVVDSDGAVSLTGTTTASGDVCTIPFEEPFTVTKEMVDAGFYYHINNTSANNSMQFVFEDGQGFSTGWSFSSANRVATIQATNGFIGKTITRMRWWSEANVATNLSFAPEFSFDPTATDYTAYNGRSIPITIPTPPGTVYGGTLDVVTGVLTVTHKSIDMGTLLWRIRNESANRQAWKILDGYVPSDMKVVENTYPYPAPLTCDFLKTVVPNTTWMPYQITQYDTSPVVTVKPAEFASTDDFIAFVTGHQLVYELKDPVTYQLTPTEVQQLVGQNNIWADSGTTVTVTYRSN